jgi:hypothetical protein
MLAAIIMDILLQRKYKYKIEGSLQEVKSKIEAILKSSWYDISLTKNIWGQFISDNSFIAKPKFTIPITILGFYPHYAVLQGKLSFEQERTIIRLTARPTILVLLLFYFLLILFTVKMLSIKGPITFDSFLGPIAIAFGLIILFSIVSFTMTRLKNRFDSFMGIKMRQ